MEEYINSKFEVSPFLNQFLTINGLYSKEGLVSLGDEEMRDRVSKFSFIHIGEFAEFIETYFGFNGTVEEFWALHKEEDFFDLLKPGDYAQLVIIQEAVTGLKGPKKKNKPKKSSKKSRILG